MHAFAQPRRPSKNPGVAGVRGVGLDGRLGSAHVLLVLGADLDHLAFLDEEGDLHDQARLELGHLGAASAGGIAAHTGLGVGDGRAVW